MTRILVLAVATCLATGCIDTDPTVFVDPSIEQPAANVQVSSLSAGLGGSFVLRLHLGSRASGDSQVTLQQFSVVGADGSEIHAPLAIRTDKPSPITVRRGGEDPLVTATFAADDNLLDLSAVDALCAPDGIAIRGAITDSLQEASVPVASEPFSVTDCP